MPKLFLRLSGDPSAVFHSAFDLMDAKTLAAHEPKYIPGGATIALLPVLQRPLAHETAPSIEFILTIGSNLALNAISSYIYEKLNCRKHLIKLRINLHTIPVNEIDISQAIEKVLTSRR